MPQVSEQLTMELQQIIKEAYGQGLTFEQTSQVGNTLVNYFDLLAKIYHQMQEDRESDAQNT